ncbi:MAG TPA: SDR family NAD(P)-dependent oxidoreductase [Fimbriimonadaceae bacterium]|nr:SDR family NAD(P)-dependent oxidoreductase [Fimbriimonadaceae bacterium]
MTTDYKRAIIVGASSGIGEELARQLATAGCGVAVLGRRLDRLQKLASEFQPDLVLCYKHDVRQFDEIPALFQSITNDLGGLDLFIYSSGVMPTVGPDEFEFSIDRQILEVNVLGAVAWLNEAAVRFGNVGHGVIVGIGSVAGDRGRAGQPVYNASKAFLASYLESLRNRLSTKGVRVTTVKPGPVQTGMTAGLQLNRAMPASTAAKLILAKSSSGRECYLSPIHAAIFLAIRNVPSWIFRRLRI